MEFSEKERRFVELLHKADSTEYLMVVAILCSGVEQNGADLVEGYTRADFKRAIKRLRVLQKQKPQYAECCGEAIEHIRREWLHRGMAV